MLDAVVRWFGLRQKVGMRRTEKLTIYRHPVRCQEELTYHGLEHIEALQSKTLMLYQCGDPPCSVSVNLDKVFEVEALVRGTCQRQNL